MRLPVLLTLLLCLTGTAYAAGADAPGAIDSQRQDDPASPDEAVEEPSGSQGDEEESVGEDEELSEEEEGSLDESQGQDTDPEEIQSEDEPSLLDQLRAEALMASKGPVPPLQRYPHLEWHGYFRFRSALFAEADLGTYFALTEEESTATSLFLPPLSRNFVNSSGGASFAQYIKDNSENTLGTATMRLRLAPIIHLSPSIRLGTRIDVLDNIVLGSTPDYMYGGRALPGVVVDTMTQSQVPPSSGINSFSDSLSVKEAWAEWDIGAAEDGTGLPLGTLKLGRFAWGWGLGIYASTGDYERGNGVLTPLERFNALDADSANYLDRVQWQLPVAGLRLHAAYAFLATGPNSNLYGTSLRPYDLDDIDDVNQLELAVTTLPSTSDEWADYRKRLTSGRPALDWGFLVSYRYQDMAFASDLATGNGSANFSDLELRKRNAWLVVPDLFARMDWRPDPTTRIYLGLEATTLVGSIGNPSGTPGEESVDIRQWGAAFESNITMGMVSFGLDLGVASGDSPEMVAVASGREVPWAGDNSWDSFAFNRNYKIDMLLYREVLGGISNTMYFRPHFDFDIIPTEQNSFGGLISGIYGLSLDPDAYAGDSRHLGVELDAMLFYEEANHFMATLAFGVLLPMWAMDRPADYLITGAPAKDSVWAWTLQGNLFFVF